MGNARTSRFPKKSETILCTDLFAQEADRIVFSTTPSFAPQSVVFRSHEIAVPIRLVVFRAVAPGRISERGPGIAPLVKLSFRNARFAHPETPINRPPTPLALLRPPFVDERSAHRLVCGVDTFHQHHLGTVMCHHIDTDHGLCRRLLLSKIIRHSRRKTGRITGRISRAIARSSMNRSGGHQREADTAKHVFEAHSTPPF